MFSYFLNDDFRFFIFSLAFAIVTMFSIFSGAILLDKVKTYSARFIELTREQAIAEHRKMWRWIAEETEKRKCKVDKDEYFDYMCLKEIHNNCFCCEYVCRKSINNRDGVIDCKYCPIDWKSKRAKFMCEDKKSYDDHDGYYRKWRFTDKTNWERAAKYARIIAELPERSYDFANPKS